MWIYIILGSLIFYYVFVCGELHIFTILTVHGSVALSIHTVQTSLPSISQQTPHSLLYTYFEFSQIEWSEGHVDVSIS